MKPLLSSCSFPLIPVACFLFGWHSQASAVLVTFQVDLSIQESINRFDPNSDIVEVRGGFNGWTGGTELSRDANDTYSTDVDLADAPGSTVEFKFVIVDGNGTVIWESDVGVGQSNRSFVLEETDQALPVEFFDNLSVNPGAGIDVTFQVDMAARIQNSTFDPDVDFVSVRGPFNNWDTGNRLAPIAEGSTIFRGTATVEFILPGTNVPYKYIINDGEWETGDNRVFKLENKPHTIPTRFFDDIEPVEIIPLGVLQISAVINGAFTLTWERPEAVLQGTENLQDGWGDIAAAAGKTELSLSTDLAKTLFFRLVSP